MPLFGRKEKAESTVAKGFGSERDLRHLRRIDLLELLLDQIRENEEKATKIDELNALVEHLKDRLDEKDVRIERLLKNVDDRDAEITSLSNRNRALAHAQGMLDVDEILEISDIAVDMYLTRISGGTVRPVETSTQHEFQRASDRMPLFRIVEQDDCVEASDHVLADADDAAVSETDKVSEHDEVPEVTEAEKAPELEEVAVSNVEAVAEPVAVEAENMAGKTTAPLPKVEPTVLSGLAALVPEVIVEPKPESESGLKPEI